MVLTTTWVGVCVWAGLAGRPAQRRAVSCAAGGRGESTAPVELPDASKLRGGAPLERLGLRIAETPLEECACLPVGGADRSLRVQRAQVTAAPAASAAQRGWTALVLSNNYMFQNEMAFVSSKLSPSST